MRSALRSAALVDAWLDVLAPDQRPTALRLRDLVFAACPDLEAGPRWGNLMFTRSGTHAVAIAVQRGYVQLQVFNGHLLAHRFPELEGSKNVRHLRFAQGGPIDEMLVRDIVVACVRALPDAEKRRVA